MDEPSDLAARHVGVAQGRAGPKELNWDLWIGPAPFRDYSPDIAPFKWRGWWDFGAGALGDMGCHIMDMPYWALGLAAPDWVDTKQEGGTAIAAPLWSTVTYHFPTSFSGAPVKFVWYDGVTSKEGVYKHTPPEELWKAEFPTADHVFRRFDLVLVGEKGRMFFAVRARTGLPARVPDERLHRAAETIAQVLVANAVNAATATTGHQGRQRWQWGEGRQRRRPVRRWLNAIKTTPRRFQFSPPPVRSARPCSATRPARRQAASGTPNPPGDQRPRGRGYHPPPYRKGWERPDARNLPRSVKFRPRRPASRRIPDLAMPTNPTGPWCDRGPAGGGLAAFSHSSGVFRAFDDDRAAGSRIR